MRAKTMQITWHAKQGQKNDPILSVDFHPTFPLLATAGADNEVKVWRLIEAGVDSITTGGAGAGAGASTADPRVEFVLTLVGHTKTVNGVRFSPNGECLASVSDDGVCAIWRLTPGCTWDTVASDKQVLRTYFRCVNIYLYFYDATSYYALLTPLPSHSPPLSPQTSY